MLLCPIINAVYLRDVYVKPLVTEYQQLHITALYIYIYYFITVSVDSISNMIKKITFFNLLVNYANLGLNWAIQRFVRVSKKKEHNGRIQNFKLRYKIR